MRNDFLNVINIFATWFCIEISPEGLYFHKLSICPWLYRLLIIVFKIGPDILVRIQVRRCWKWHQFVSHTILLHPSISWLICFVFTRIILKTKYNYEIFMLLFLCPLQRRGVHIIISVPLLTGIDLFYRNLPESGVSYRNRLQKQGYRHNFRIIFIFSNRGA